MLRVKTPRLNVEAQVRRKKNQLFQFDGVSYEQTDGVAMDSPLGPLLANVFLCSIGENLEEHGQLPRCYWRYVRDTLTVMPGWIAAG